MKKIILLLVILVHSTLYSQSFTKYYTWASEKHKDPGDNPLDGRLDWKYDDVMHVVNSDFNNDSIPELGLIINDEGALKIFTIESRGFRILDPDVNYKKANIVNKQEGLSLEKKGDDGARYDAYTEHSTNDRTAATITNVVSQAANIHFALAGNFFPDPYGFDEIMFLYDNGDHQDFLLLENNKTSNTMSYEFQINFNHCHSQNSIYFDEVDFVVAGNFDSDSLDEIAILLRTGADQNMIYILSYNSTSYSLDLKHTFTDQEIDFRNVTHVVAGDFSGNNRDDLAFAYIAGIDHSISIYNIPINKFVWVYGENNRNIFDLHKATHIISGNFDGDLSQSGCGIEELAIFYDNGTGNLSTDTIGLSAVQQVLISDHSDLEWNLNPVIYEHRLNMDFSSKITRFAFSNNFDYDVMGRDDIGVLYMDDYDLNDDGQSLDYNKILMWLSLPDFDTENDFIMNTTYSDASTTITDKFFPLGIHHARLVTGYKENGVYVDHIIPYDTAEYVGGAFRVQFCAGRNTDEQIDYIKKHFNMCMPCRLNFTDGQYGDMDNSESDFWYYDTDESVDGLRAYIRVADSLGLLVVPALAVTTCSSYDLCTAGSYWNYPNRQFKTFETIDSFPTFFKEVFTDPEITSAKNIPFWYLGEEPSSKTYNSKMFPYSWAFVDPTGSGTMTDPCSGTLTITVDTVLHVLENVHSVLNNMYPGIKIFHNFNEVLSFNFYSHTYDWAQHNPFPFGYSWDSGDTFKLFSPSYPYQVIYNTNLSKIRKNKDVALFQVETLGYPEGNIAGETEPYMRSGHYTPSYEQLRWLTFTPVTK
ncbi:hypothetical protein ACFLSQ_11610 [Bacteroidota bacterium]